MASIVIFSSELQRFTGEAQTDIQATDYRSLVTEVLGKYPKLDEDEILKMAVAINGELVHDPFLQKIPLDSEVHFLFRIEGG